VLTPIDPDLTSLLSPPNHKKQKLLTARRAAAPGAAGRPSPSSRPLAVAPKAVRLSFPLCTNISLSLSTQRRPSNTFTSHLQQPPQPNPKNQPKQKQKQLLDFFKPKKAAPPPPPKRVIRPTVTPPPSFAIPATLAALSLTSGLVGHNGGAAGLFGVLGAFLAIQATRVRFVFDDEALEVVISGKQPGDDGAATENAFVGGRNRWPYESFVNWEFWWPGFPVLVYFKETQTKPEGQIHFFPIIFDGGELYKVMKERCGPSVGSGGKGDDEEEDDDE
jgi:hypothetical protein